MAETPQNQNQTQTQDQTVNFYEAEEQPSMGVLGGDVNVDLTDAVSPTVNTGDTDLGLVDGLSVLPDAADVSDLGVLNALNVLPDAADGGVSSTLSVLPSATELADAGGLANDLTLSDTLSGLSVSDVLTDTADLGTGNIADNLVGGVTGADNGGSLIGDVVGDVANTGDGGSLVSDVVGNVASPDGSLVGGIVADAASTDGDGSLVSDVVNADGLTANVSDIAEQGFSVADDADALGNVLNGESVGSIADLDGNSILNDLADTGADATGAADLSSFLSALNDVNASDLTDGIANGNLTDADVGGALTHLTGPIGGGDGGGTSIDLSDVGALVSPDFATDIPVDTMVDGLLSQVDLHDIADVGGIADHG